MVLQQQVTFLRHAEALKLCELGTGNKLLKLGRPAYVLDYLVAVQIMLHRSIFLDDDAALIPFPNFFHSVLGPVGGDNVIKRGYGTISVFAEFGIGMLLVVEHLVFTADTRFAIGIKFLVYKVLHTAVGTFCEFEFECELECGTFFPKACVAFKLMRFR